MGTSGHVLKSCMKQADRRKNSCHVIDSCNYNPQNSTRPRRKKTEHEQQAQSHHYQSHIYPEYLPNSYVDMHHQQRGGQPNKCQQPGGDEKKLSFRVGVDVPLPPRRPNLQLLGLSQQQKVSQMSQKMSPCNLEGPCRCEGPQLFRNGIYDPNYRNDPNVKGHRHDPPSMGLIHDPTKGMHDPRLRNSRSSLGRHRSVEEMRTLRNVMACSCHLMGASRDRNLMGACRGVNPSANCLVNPNANCGVNPNGNCGVNPNANCGVSPSANCGVSPSANCGVSPTANCGINPSANCGVNPSGNVVGSKDLGIPNYHLSNPCMAVNINSIKTPSPTGNNKLGISSSSNNSPNMGENLCPSLKYLQQPTAPVLDCCFCCNGGDSRLFPQVVPPQQQVYPCNSFISTTCQIAYPVQTSIGNNKMPASSIAPNVNICKDRRFSGCDFRQANWLKSASERSMEDITNKFAPNIAIDGGSVRGSSLIGENNRRKVNCEEVQSHVEQCEPLLPPKPPSKSVSAVQKLSRFYPFSSSNLNILSNNKKPFTRAFSQPIRGVKSLSQPINVTSQICEPVENSAHVSQPMRQSRRNSQPIGSFPAHMCHPMTPSACASRPIETLGCASRPIETRTASDNPMFVQQPDSSSVSHSATPISAPKRKPKSSVVKLSSIVQNTTAHVV